MTTTTTTCTLPANTKLPQQQDLAMEDFRKAFRLVAGCNVSLGGYLMTYQLKTTANMATWLACANSIIITHNLPLIAKIRPVMHGKEVVGVELRIIYIPK